MSAITAGKFSYSSLGLLYDLEPRCTQAVILQRLRNSGQVNVRWLKGQLAHYGLKPLTGTKDELEARLVRAINEGKVKQQPKEMREMERGLKAAFDARLPSSGGGGGGGGGGQKAAEKPRPKTKVEKPQPKPKASSEPKTKVQKPLPKPKIVSAPRPPATAKRSSASAGVARQSTAAPGTAKGLPAKPKPPPAPVADKPKAPSKPRVPFAEQLIGSYTIECRTFPIDPSTLDLDRSAQSLSGRLDLGGRIVSATRLEWMPMAKQSRVPFTGDFPGEMEFKIAKGEVKVKGKISTQRWGEVEWSGVKTGAVAHHDWQNESDGYGVKYESDDDSDGYGSHEGNVKYEDDEGDYYMS